MEGAHNSHAAHRLTSLPVSSGTTASRTKDCRTHNLPQSSRMRSMGPHTSSRSTINSNTPQSLPSSSGAS
ncbi:hypothetical protein BDY21DRAFT_331099 [Lineolata rhizophorae]|uniref:Uncharacterized protein n=1 Tax=Lineolata rhizophorae TaxID=578093 RepID=A0A6A6PEC0_9PEZI|nr:hypothetical protein BDY21DRAFT_331099 [Lineolata rhizophorae]